MGMLTFPLAVSDFVWSQERTSTKKGSAQGCCLEVTRYPAVLSHAHTNFCFMHRLIEVFNRLYAMPLEIMFRDLELMLGGTHVLQSFVDMRMAFRCRCQCRNRWRS